MLPIGLLKNCVLFRLKIQCFGNSRKGDLSDEAVNEIIGKTPRQAGQTDQQYEAECNKRIADAKRRLKLGKSLITAAEFDAIKEFQTGIRNTLLSRFCNPSFIDEGLYAVKTSVVPLVEAEIKSAIERLQSEFVPAFVKVYPDKVADAKKLFNGQFRERDYPGADELPGLFGFSYRWIQLDVPEGLPPEIREQEEKKLRETYEQAQQAIQGALWAEFSKFLQHVTDRLAPGPDGKRKTFRDSLFVDLSEFINAFGNRNAFNDTKLAAVVAQAQAALAAIGGDTTTAAGKMRDFDGIRATTANAFEKIKAEVEKTIADMPKRAFALED